MMDLFSLLERYWNRFETVFLLLALALVSVVLFALGLAGFWGADFNNFRWYFLGAGLLAAVASAYWWYTHRLPQCPTDKVGFLVSIRSEHAHESMVIKRDFGQEIATRLKQAPIQVMQLMSPHVERVVDHDSAFKYSNKCRAHFHIFGDVRKRRVKNKEVYALRLDGMVRHAPASDKVRRDLSHEMTEVLPLNRNLPLEDDLAGFEFTSVWMAESAKYVIATAAMLSNDYSLAIDLLESLYASRRALEQRLNSAPAAGWKKLLKKLPERLAHAHFLAARADHAKWRETHVLSDLQSGWEHTKRSHALARNSKNYNLYQGIWLFVSRRDVAGALKSIMACVSQNIADPTWRYSAAFLEAYCGNEEKALQHYDAAISFETNAGLVFEIEEFIAWVLSVEPEHYQMYFCLGFINYKAKGDVTAAKQDFELFLQKCKDGEFTKFKARAERILGETAPNSMPVERIGDRLELPGSSGHLISGCDASLRTHPD